MLILTLLLYSLFFWQKSCIFLTGSLRIKFDLKCWYAGVTGYGRIYRNGVAVGIEQTVTNGDWQTESEDIAGWTATDLIQLYVHTTDITKAATVRNFRVYGSIY